MKDDYIFTSERLGFRKWDIAHIGPFAEMNADPEVMAHFPSVLKREESIALIDRLKAQFTANGYCYYAVDVLATKSFIGFIGLSKQVYTAPFTPATDIGWRLKKNAWGKGYATEGAKRCLEYAFETLQLNSIVSVCTLKNSKSESVMKKIGMHKQGEFLHPNLSEFPEYQRCLWYAIHAIKK